MRLKRALSQIKPTDGQRDKIYGDILEKLSEKSPEKKKETRIIMKKKTVFSTAAAAVLAVALAGGTVYAVSPEVRETVNNLLGINRQAAEDYYGIFNDDSVNNVDIIESTLTVTENDFTEFSPGIRAKLVSVINCGSFAEAIVEFEFDEPIKDGEYTITDVNISAYPKYVSSYTFGFLMFSDSGKIYGNIKLNDIKNLPENMTVNMEITELDKTNNEGISNTSEKYGGKPSAKIQGSFSADFTIGSPIKPNDVEFEPKEINWTSKSMDGKTAHMELTKLKYSPKEIIVDLRMIDDCLVICNNEYGGSQYLNNTTMFYDGLYGGNDNPIKLKMSDGTLKDIWYSEVSSNAVNDIDKNTLVTDMDWIMASWDIYSDRPTTVTFELSGIMDYADVEAIVFCGVEIPITEKNF